jgi:cell division protein ZipA
MDDLRWVLALVGALVVAAIYLSSRFERDDWQREREQRGSRAKVVPRPGKREPRMNEAAKVTPASPAASSATADITTEAIGSDTGDSATDLTQAPAVGHTAVEKSEDGQREPHFIPDSLAPAEVTVTPATEQAQFDTGVKERKPQQVDDTTQLQSEANMRPAATERQAEPAEVPTMDLDADVEDEIVDVEIPQDLSAVEAELQAGSEAEDILLSEPAQVSLPLGIEPLVLVVTVLAEEDQTFTGADIEEAMTAEGLAYGDMRIFHFFAAENNAPQMENREAVFSLANLVEPGYFERERMAELETPGLSLFCQLPGPLPGNEALECMLDKARGLAVRLQGRMCDDKRNIFTTQAKTHYQDRIAAFERELVLARKKL